MEYKPGYLPREMADVPTYHRGQFQLANGVKNSRFLTGSYKKDIAFFEFWSRRQNNGVLLSMFDYFVAYQHVKILHVREQTQINNTSWLLLVYICAHAITIRNFCCDNMISLQIKAKRLRNLVQWNPDLPRVLVKAKTRGKSGCAVNRVFGD